MWRTIKYRIESAWIPQTPGFSREIWFLDAVQEDENGRRSTSNICSGSKDYCIETRNHLLLSHEEIKQEQPGREPCRSIE